MKITDIKVYITDAYRTNWTFIKVEMDQIWLSIYMNK